MKKFTWNLTLTHRNITLLRQIQNNSQKRQNFKYQAMEFHTLYINYKGTFSMIQNKINTSIQKSYLLTKLIVVACLLVFCCAVQTKQIQGVIHLSQDTWQQALNKFPYLVVYFSSEQCKYCLEMDTTYAIIEQKYRKSLENGKIKLKSQNVVEFGKIIYHQNPEIFKAYQIKEAPTIKIFKHGQIMDINYDCLDYNEDAIEYTLQWIQRAITPLQEIKTKPQVTNKPIAVISCKSPQKQEFNKLRIRDVDADFYCTNNQSLIAGPRSLKIYSKSNQNGQLYTLPINNIQNKITKFLFRHKGLLPWNNYAIRNIFTYKHNAFVLLTNYDDYSGMMKNVIETIRDKEDINEMFVVGNLSENLQQVAKIKQYIGVSVLAVYSFPLLVYLSHQDGIIIKYAFNKEIEQYIQSARDEKSILDIDTQAKYNVADTLAWMHSAINGEAKQHIRTASKQQFKLPRNSHGVINRLNRADLDELFSLKYDIQSFLYITWRNDYFCSSIEQELINNWGRQQASEYTNMFSIGLNNNDLTHQLQRYITRVPAIIYISKQKEIVFFDEIINFADVQQFINNQYQPIEISETIQAGSIELSASISQDEKQQKQEQQKASQVQSNLDHLNVMKKNQHTKKSKTKNQKQNLQIKDDKPKTQNQNLVEDIATETEITNEKQIIQQNLKTTSKNGEKIEREQIIVE